MNGPPPRRRCNPWIWTRNLSLCLGIVSLVLHFITFHRLWGIDDQIELQLQMQLQMQSVRRSAEWKQRQGQKQAVVIPNNNKKPLVVAAGELLSPVDDLLKLALEEKKARKNSPHPDVLVVSPLGNTTSRRPDYKRGSDNPFTLECSLQHYHHKPLIRATFDDGDGYDSLDIRKVQVVYETARDLLSSNVSATTLMIVVDAFDVIFQKTPLELLHEYDDQKYPIVVGGEFTCWDPATGDVQSNRSTPFCSLPNEQRLLNSGYYLNSGVYMSTLGTLVRFLEVALQQLPTAADGLVPWPGTTDKFNDQAYWSYWYVHYHPLIGLDNKEKLSLITNIGKIRNFRTRFNYNGKFTVQMIEPGILHFPGKGAKQNKKYKDGIKYYRQLCKQDGNNDVRLVIVPTNTNTNTNATK